MNPPHSFPYEGYTRRGGLYERTVMFPNGRARDQVETLVRDPKGRLLRVERTGRGRPVPGPITSHSSH